MIQTERLILSIASDEEMRLLTENEPEEEMKAAYGEMLSGCLAHPELRQWYAVWFIRLHSGKTIGDYCFKGLSDDGCVEIGYGLQPEYWGKGYTTEAVIAAVDWALRQPGVKRIEAETDPDNTASQRVLEKSGFVPTGTNGEEGPRFVWCGSSKPAPV
ncbi:MAG: GNAT family N-acetyltransferase [Oscillospiraceae bacterium]|nr:GNAT family N-acetyltransferase [Oscillospiraceae bacterium]